MVVALTAVVAAVLAIGTALFVFDLPPGPVPGTSTGAADTITDDPDEGGQLAAPAFADHPAPTDAGATATTP